MKITNYLSIYKRVMSTCFAIILLSGCDQTNVEYSLPGSDDNPIGEPVALNISLQDFSEYNTTDRSTAATRSEKPLISEYVRLNNFSLMRSTEESENPKSIGIMELYEDTVPPSPQSRSTMAKGNYFRLIMFRKVGNDYVFQAAADYTSNGTSVPELKQGEVLRPIRGQTYRFVGYSYNNNTEIGGIPDKYQWNVTSISIPNMENDFLTYDSGDKNIISNADTYPLSVTFSHRLCKLTVTVQGENSVSISIDNSAGIYIKKGGNKSSWTVGPNMIAADTGDSAIDFPAGSTSGTGRLVPFSASRPIEVQIGKISVAGGGAMTNVVFTSNQSVQLVAGRSYTMEIKITSVKYIKVPASQINLGANCTAKDKAALSQLTWAGGNLNSSDNSKPYTYAPKQSDFGYYYTWMSSYTGNTTSDGKDPCTRLDPAIYGTGWRYPTVDEFRMLIRCTDGSLTDGGLWFMRKHTGLFLPAAGYRTDFEGGSSTSPSRYGIGNYRGSGQVEGTLSAELYFESYGYINVMSFPKTNGLTVRCVRL